MAMTGSATVVRSVIRYRRFIVIITQLALVALSNVVALWLKFGDSAIVDATSIHRNFFWRLFRCWSLSAVWHSPALRLYEGLWRYSSIWEASQHHPGRLSEQAWSSRSSCGWRPDTTTRASVLIIDSVLLVCALEACV